MKRMLERTCKRIKMGDELPDDEYGTLIAYLRKFEARLQAKWMAELGETENTKGI